MKDVLISGFLLGILHGLMQPAYSRTVVPNFTTGTVTSETTTTTTIKEVINQTDYRTGHSYTVTGRNINIPKNPQLGARYTIQNQGEPFQFSETYVGPGVASTTQMTRDTQIDSFTTSISVFTQ